jgi:NADH-quinone oxidoreductase subunit F
VQGLIRHFRHEIERRIDDFSRNADKHAPSAMQAAE